MQGVPAHGFATKQTQGGKIHYLRDDDDDDDDELIMTCVYVDGRAADKMRDVENVRML